MDVLDSLHTLGDAIVGVASLFVASHNRRLSKIEDTSDRLREKFDHYAIKKDVDETINKMHDCLDDVQSTVNEIATNVAVLVARNDERDKHGSR